MLRKLGPARALDPCDRPEGSWALVTRMARADDAKIVCSRDAQCNTKELP